MILCTAGLKDKKCRFLKTDNIFASTKKRRIIKFNNLTKMASDNSEEFQQFKNKMSSRKRGSISASNAHEKMGKGRRRSSVMVEYFRDNYMGIEVR